jgi:hypothetical protein
MCIGLSVSCLCVRGRTPEGVLTVPCVVSLVRITLYESTIFCGVCSLIGMFAVEVGAFGSG